MKLCACGYAGTTHKKCSCSEGKIRVYRQRVSGPLLDRIDLHVTMSAVALQELGDAPRVESSSSIRARVESARRLQRRRSRHYNAQVSGRPLTRRLLPSAKTLLQQAGESLGLSARAYHRVLRVARTIADLEASECITEPHVGEALRYRPQT